MSIATPELGPARTVRRTATIVIMAALLLTMMPLSPAAEAEPLPSKAERIDGFEDDGAASGSETDPEAEADADLGPLDATPNDGAGDDDAPTPPDPERATTSEPTEAPFPFSMIGFEMPEDAIVAFRTSTGGDDWSDWSVAEPVDEEDGPDEGTAEKAAENTAPMSDPFWVEEASHIQIEVEGAEPGDIRAHILDTNGLSATFGERFSNALSRPLIDVGGQTAEAATRPSVRSRSHWDPNDECTPRRGPSYAANVNRVVVHHTAGSNTYSDGNSVIRGICLYHRNGQGWNDIGYNMLVDRFGNVYEGRRGGIERAVIGAHAAGHNTGSFGIGVMGNFDVAHIPQAAFNAVAQTIAWKMRLHGVAVSSSTIVGHRDVGSTACPGRHFYARMGELRSQVGNQLNTSANFSDISGSHAPFIRDIAQQGITAGCGGSRYCPDRDVTRGQMATFLQRAEGSQRPYWGALFSDVATTHTHSPDINAALRAGWTTGCNGSGTRYCPSAGVTRAEMAVFLVRANPSLSPRDDGTRFRDVPANMSHRPYINAIADAGITEGCGNERYCPDRIVSRAEMATFISRSMQRGLG